MKKLYLAGLLLTTGLIILTLPVLAQEFLEIQITNDDNHLTFNTLPIPENALDSTDGQIIPITAGITNADKVIHLIDNITPIPSDALDSSDGQIIPVQAAVCNSDKTLTLKLTPIDFSATTPEPESKPEPPEPAESKLAKTPVLFVPGLLGTRAYENQNEIWPNIFKIETSYSDNFLDILQLNDVFQPIDTNIVFKEVIKTEPFTDYIQGLINAFQEQGYTTDEGAVEQDFFTFPYDWRYGVSGIIPSADNVSQKPLTNIDLLSARINQLAAISPTGKVDVIAHSLGGLVVKKYVIDADNPSINKLIFVGTPNLGAPLSAKTLLQGHNFDIFGLNPDEIKKISRNLPSAYDLLPSFNYFNTHSGYITLVRQKDFLTNEVKTLNYNETDDYLLSTGLTNQQGISNAKSWHTSAFDEYDIAAKVPNTYNLVGCQSATYSMLEDWQDSNGNHRWYENGIPLTGDGTVPFESADSILTNPQNTNNIFYIPKANHGKMPSQEIIKQKIVDIITNHTNTTATTSNQIFTYQQVKVNPKLCQLFGDIIEIHSPLDITVTDGNGNTLQNIPNQGYDNTIPGASFYLDDNNHKSVYLPRNNNETYDIKLIGTGTGTFTLIDKKLDNQTITSTYIFKDEPVTPDFSAILRLADDTNNTNDTNDNTSQSPLIILPDNTQIKPAALTLSEVSNDKLIDSKNNDSCNSAEDNSKTEDSNKVENNNNSSNNNTNNNTNNSSSINSSSSNSNSNSNSGNNSSNSSNSSNNNRNNNRGQRIIPPAVAGASTYRLSLQEIAASLEKIRILINQLAIEITRWCQTLPQH